jgi:hypothetical protein
MENHHATHHSSLQQRFNVNIWARIVDDYVIRSYIIQDHHDEAHHADFLEETLLLLVKDVPLHVQEHVVSAQWHPSPFCTGFTIGMTTFWTDGLEVDVRLPGLFILPI